MQNFLAIPAIVLSLEFDVKRLDILPVDAYANGTKGRIGLDIPHT